MIALELSPFEKSNLGGVSLQFAHLLLGQTNGNQASRKEITLPLG